MGLETPEWRGWKPRFDSFVGVDSDGCVFDTMGAKQIRHFHPLILRFWHLETLEPELRQTAEFVNLHSRWRGSNRFPALLRTLDLFSTRADVRRRHIALPDLRALRAYVESGLPLGNPSLRQEVERTGDPELRRVLDWSRAVDRDITERLPPIPPFDGVRDTLAELAKRADLLVVSQTPEPALRREWTLHQLTGFVRDIAGQEQGTKADHLRMAAVGKYALDRILMVGDAPGDLAAAEETGVLFFPILPGSESASWKRLREEAFPRFLGGTFDAAYQAELIRRFEHELPDAPPWAV